MGPEATGRVLGLVHDWVVSLPNVRERAATHAAVLICREELIPSGEINGLAGPVSDFLDQQRPLLDGLTFVRVARAQILGGAKELPTFFRSAVMSMRAPEPFLCMTPDGLAFFSRPYFAELIYEIRDLDLVRFWPAAVKKSLLNASRQPDTAAFQVEACLRQEEGFIEIHVPEDVLAEVAKRVEEAGQEWVATCRRVADRGAISRGAKKGGFALPYDELRSRMRKASQIDPLSEYSAFYVAVTEILEDLPGVLREFRPILLLELASMISRLEYTELIEFLPKYLEIAQPEDGRKVDQIAPALECVERVLSGLFGYPHPVALAMPVQASRRPLG